jgi:hypothetical protein
VLGAPKPKRDHTISGYMSEGDACNWRKTTSRSPAETKGRPFSFDCRLRWTRKIGQEVKLGLLLRRTDRNDGQTEAVFGGFQGKGCS